MASCTNTFHQKEPNREM
jgi:hypothetical protein